MEKKKGKIEEIEKQLRFVKWYLFFGFVFMGYPLVAVFAWILAEMIS